MPVGAFRPDAKTETVKPGGSLISPPFPGSKKAVSDLQSGFATTLAAVAAAGSNINGGAVRANPKAVEGFNFMTLPPLDFLLQGAWLSLLLRFSSWQA